MFYPNNPVTTVGYKVVAPLTPSPTFRATVSETIKDAFDKDLNDALFKDGSVKLIVDVENGLPLGLDMKLEVLDAAETKLFDLSSAGGAKIAPRTQAGPAKSEVEFTIDDMEAMKTARHIRFDLVATGSQAAAGIALNPAQQLVLGIKFRKTGGITI
jgi:hypothetical protein